MKKKYLLIIINAVFISLQAQTTIQKFAIIGDFGLAGSNEAAVATMVKSWNPAYIITLGDNNYPDGVSATIDANIGKYYQSYIYPYTGSYGAGASSNKFYPCIGNHDYNSTNNYGTPYYNYFSLPGNERYYDFIKGDVHFFVINSNSGESAGVSSSSTQAMWLKSKLQNSSSKWNIVYFHHSPYCSDNVGSVTYMRWPFKSWGADAVLSGHSHVYERLIVDGIPYFVNGVGGSNLTSFKTPLSQSKFRYNSSYGAMLCTEYSDKLTFKFYNKGNSLIDSYSITKNQASLNVNITEPSNNASFTIGSSITIKASTSGGTGVIQKVEFFAGSTKLGEDLTSPYSFAWNNAAIGSYALKAKVTDNSNTSASSSLVNISVVAPDILSVNITSPANNSSFTVGSTINIKASVSGGTGAIQKVEFFAGSTKLAEDLTSPYSFAWNNAAIGTYALKAKATDGVNNTDVSTVITISVMPVAEVICSTSGSITREVWNNISGKSVRAIPLDTVPGSTEQLAIFEAPANIADNYGQRIRGYVCPPFTGNYMFWIASDDSSELYLSIDNDPVNKLKIASVTGFTTSREWTKYSSQQSAAIYLTAGEKYYIEALHKEEMLEDNCAVGWQLPNGTMERPVPGNRISPFEIPPPLPAGEFISTGGSWKYLDNGTNQGTSWTATSFTDATWKTGNAELGYGDGAEATVVSYGSSSTNKYITTYFRKKFNIIDKSTISGLELSLVRDDGAVVFINGVELYRTNLPTGAISYNTLASSAIDGTNESAWLLANLSSSSLVNGTNVIAVEIHQSSKTSSDISFNLKLKALNGTPSVCQVPSGLTASSITSSSAALGWSAVTNALSYDVQYRITGTTSWTTSNTNVNSKAISGLSSSSAYEFQVRSVCSSSASNYSAPQTFITPDTAITGGGVELIPAGSSWKYLDNGTNQGTTWRESSFNDSIWKTGNAELGYGDGAEATIVSYGPSSTNKFITTYFRDTFNITDKSTISGLELSLIRDDGAVVYINGAEVYRTNLPSGTIYYNTLAPTYIDGTSESTWVLANLSSSSLVNGINVIAAEIHQNAITSSDISFNLKLKTLSGNKILNIITPGDSLQQNPISENSYDMIIYPNPTTGQFNLELCMEDLAEKTVVIEVTNSLAQVVYKKQPRKVNGCIKETIDLDSSLPTGVYIMKVTIDDKVQTSKMLLTK